MDCREVVAEARELAGRLNLHPRLAFQRLASVGSVLNVGSKEDPARLRELGAVNLDVKLVDEDYGRSIEDVVDVVGDAESLPFRDKSFDTVVLGDVLEHLDDPLRAVAEARRVARRRVVATVPSYPDPRHRWVPTYEEVRRAFPRASICYYEDESWRGFLVVEEVGAAPEE